jgi:hypothetical protein
VTAPWPYLAIGTWQALHTLPIEGAPLHFEQRRDTSLERHLVGNGRVHQDHSDDALSVQIGEPQRLKSTERVPDHHIGASDAGPLQRPLEVCRGVCDVLRFRGRAAEAVASAIPGADARSLCERALDEPPRQGSVSQPCCQDDGRRAMPKADEIDSASFSHVHHALGRQVRPNLLLDSGGRRSATGTGSWARGAKDRAPTGGRTLSLLLTARAQAVSHHTADCVCQRLRRG